MKKQIFALVLTAIFSCALNLSFAQQNSKPASEPKWASDKGFWVIEGNKNTPLKNTIYFYNPAHVLVYKEQLDGVRLRLRQRKVLVRLKNVLEQSVAAWEAKHVAQENEMRVALALRK